MKPGFKRKPFPVELKWLYVERRMSLREMAADIGASTPTIRGWLREAGISIRTISEAKKGQKPAAHTVEASVRARRKRRLPGRGVVGYKVKADGYVLLWDRPTQSYRAEHRVVMEKKLGRLLLPVEDVHHRNHVRHDNRRGNLKLMPSRSAHQKEHAKTRRREGGRFA